MCNGTNDNNCLTCNIEDNRDLNNLNYCACLEKFYDIPNNQVCGACHY